MKEKEHLPIIGVGPIILAFQIAVTLFGIVLSWLGYFDFAKVDVLTFH